MKKVITIFTIFVLQTLLLGQTLITGKVTDASNGEALVGANVIAEGTGGIGSTTNADGEYSFTLPSQVVGEISVKVAYIGYKTTTSTVSLSGVPAQLDFSLTPDVLQGDLIVVTGQGLGVDKKKIVNNH